ncbi:MAG TPA: YkgJ family cysteine cluster protein [Chloroflexota bacterium]
MIADARGPAAGRTSTPAWSTPHNPCATCGACCRSYVVPVCGRDIWLITREQRLSPEQFTVAHPLPGPHPEGFRLEDGGRFYALALDKRGPFQLKRPCVFLVGLPGGHDRCGIYAHRPVGCRSYPMVARDGVIGFREDRLCPPDAWPAGEPGRPRWREAVEQVRMQFDVYAEVVGRWNARVAATPGHRFPLGEYFGYLLSVYTQIAALDDALGTDALARVRSTWRAVPSHDGGLAELRERADEHPWLAYLERVVAIVAGFYPWVPSPGDRPITPTAGPG